MWHVTAKKPVCHMPSTSLKFVPGYGKHGRHEWKPINSQIFVYQNKKSSILSEIRLLICHNLSVFSQFILSKSRIWYLQTKSRWLIKYLLASNYSIFIATDLQNCLAAMAFSTLPLTLFKSPHEQNAVLEWKKNAKFASISNFVTFSGKGFYMWMS